MFQGRIFPPLLFCLTLASLSYKLNKTGHEYHTIPYHIYESRINHLLYMDELKLYGKNDEELQRLLSRVKAFSDNIGIEVGSDKCSKATFVGEKLMKVVVTENQIKTRFIILRNRRKRWNATCKDEIRKDKIRKEHNRQVRAALQT